MAFVKDGAFDSFKRDVEDNYNALEDRVIELEKLLKKSTGGVTVDAVVPEPEPEVVEEEVVVEEPKSKGKKKSK
jgi:hypothetical protein